MIGVSLNDAEDSSSPELKQIIRDTAIAITHLLIEAEHSGLSTCWTAWFEQATMREMLGLPGDKYVCGVIAVGYAKNSPKRVPEEIW